MIKFILVITLFNGSNWIEYRRFDNAPFALFNNCQMFGQMIVKGSDLFSFACMPVIE